MELLFVILLIVNSIWCVQCGRILFVPAHSAPSHVKSMYLVAAALKQAGHNVSVLQLVDFPANATKNEIGVLDRVIRTIRDNPNCTDEWHGFVKNIVWLKPLEPIELLTFYGRKHTTVCSRILSHRSTRNAFNSIFNETWDAVVVDDFFATCGLMAIQQWLKVKRTAIVDFSVMASLFPSSVESRGANAPASTRISTTFQKPSFDSAQFHDRMTSALHTLQVSVTMELLNRLIPFWGGHMALNGINVNLLPQSSLLAVSLIPTGAEYTLPRTMDVAEFDYACPPVDSLPDHVSRFIEDPSSKGTMLFAVGHFVDWNYAPNGALQAFVKAFATLSEYRIIWQVGLSRDQIGNLTGNVMTLPWVPQTSILGHSTTKLFISHMGVKSIKETICAGVPVVGMPMFADHYRTMAMAQHRKFGVYLDKTVLSFESIYSAIRKVLDDSQYSRSVNKLKNQLSDRIMEQSKIFSFQFDFFIRRNDDRILTKFIKTKWPKLSGLTRWACADILLPFFIFLFGLGWFVI